MSKVMDDGSELTNTEIEGMMAGNWEIGTEIQVTEECQLVQIDAGIWKQEAADKRVVQFIRPQNCVCSGELREIILSPIDSEY